MKLRTEVGLGAGHIVLDGYPAFPKRVTTPNFRPMSIVAKRSPISATAEHLFYIHKGNGCECCFSDRLC